MNNLKVVSLNSDAITFDNEVRLYSDHDQDCCENHYLDFSDLTLEDFDGLEFDLAGAGFFKRIDGYGIELISTTGLPVRVPGYGSNNGYYSSNIDLVLMKDKVIIKSWDVSECQEYEPH